MTKLMRQHRCALLAAAVGLMAVAAPQIATAGPKAGSTYQLRAVVPVACWVRPDTTVVAQTGQSGSVIEACNSPGGFTISAAYRPLKATETARLTYGERSLNLAKAGNMELRRSNMAAIRTIAYRFDEVQLEESLVLALTIQPI
ncbi:hypothetical protein [Brevundimonas guildfordensis]|jgi:hypothetical protein|uniref:Uncharacterized protein n=1 Tax=Brevundimonas guildfordensis TaxID=2762241 RepID=A0ABR8QXH6_9CAUL|nr:hypothetical protein [Brevundimonas guildfordensis]MBD7940232.1 hypothetical protein [Brevundimonas guildfordensis]